MDKNTDLLMRNCSSVRSKPVQNLTASQLLHETHPSVRSRNRDCLENIFKKINSDVLSRLPTHLDPNIQFSDDDEEDEVVVDQIIKKETMKENFKIIENRVIKSPQTSPKLTMRPFDSKEMKSYNTDFHTDKKRNTIYQKHNSEVVSASKITSMRNNDSHPRNFFPHSEQKFPSFQKKLAVSSVKTNLDERLKCTLKQQMSEIGEKTLTPCLGSGSSALMEEVIAVNCKIYSLLSLLGSGGSCKVYSVFDVETKSRFAIKCVRLNNIDPVILKGYKKEIQYLNQLKDSKRVIKMYDYEQRDNELRIVLEHGDIDFAKYLSNETKVECLTPLKIKFYWTQMLEAVSDIHKHGIVHSDLKPANFLFVAGNLKLIDFGIAASVPDDNTSTFRDDQVGTLNYMSPEAVTQMSCSGEEKPVFKIGVKSDVWSLGCILYNLVYSVTPFYNIKTLFQKVRAITDPNYKIPFKPLSDNLLLDVLKSCLKRNPKERASVEELLRHPYLRDEMEEPSKPDDSFKNILEKMQNLTPRRMQYVTKIVKDLTEKSNE